VEKKPIVILCTTPDLECAKNIAHFLVTERYAACCNILPQVTSIFTWQGKIEEESEHLLIIKSNSDNFKNIEEVIIKQHPYDLPEIISIDISSGSDRYLEWLSENVR
jgi:periplasmic divalent cation tolerance protein